MGVVQSSIYSTLNSQSNDFEQLEENIIIGSEADIKKMSTYSKYTIDAILSCGKEAIPFLPIQVDYLHLNLQTSNHNMFKLYIEKGISFLNNYIKANKNVFVVSENTSTPLLVAYLMNHCNYNYDKALEMFQNKYHCISDPEVLKQLSLLNPTSYCKDTLEPKLDFAYDETIKGSPLSFRY
ncbi:hypothetical protein EIN_129310 [Entamoeba invadens IP1]|uniref:Tyrosine-protein phosphatase domain-containing protein n=1 Tax=Entamoeba invadens IP1 TaxID=370355 RepID=L7FNC7_ENTIV|nr:hypothetical protein EIN_129310 [Entamoeba invadens IP1]ELP91591.1 hypothetical protein EIN_129310 [Entamoeba invadens IP1]|eukprot:XP_004258362.1 hypothetical protein EIN_129310 [Entamoeba invadens IP1]